MKAIGHYSKEKFLSFPLVEQRKAIDKLIDALELALTDELERQRLIAHILELFAMLNGKASPDMKLFAFGLHPQLSAHQVLNKLCYYHGESIRKDSQLSIRKGDGSVPKDIEAKQKAAQVTLICDNLRSVFNLGSIFRSAECLGVAEILLCGISAKPSHPNLAKTAMGTQSLVAWRHFLDTKEAISHCRSKGMHIYALETVNEASSVFSTDYSFPLALVIGNESLGIEPSILELCDSYICLPQLGWKNSLNVGVATAAALYQIIFGARQ
jgi:tRNA(Leu) C34 or U34 (ribose-2'-O)-methylase TrmL